jgi:hypothetical protein
MLHLEPARTDHHPEAAADHPAAHTCRPYSQQQLTVSKSSPALQMGSSRTSSYPTPRREHSIRGEQHNTGPNRPQHPLKQPPSQQITHILPTVSKTSPNQIIPSAPPAPTEASRRVTGTGIRSQIGHPMERAPDTNSLKKEQPYEPAPFVALYTLRHIPWTSAHAHR